MYSFIGSSIYNLFNDGKLSLLESIRFWFLIGVYNDSIL